MLDTVLAGLLATVIVQGFKAIGWNIEGDGAKIVALCVAALFLLANGLIDLLVPVAARPLVQQIVDIIKSVLMLLVPAGLYGYAKFFVR